MNIPPIRLVAFTLFVSLSLAACEMGAGGTPPQAPSSTIPPPLPTSSPLPTHTPEPTPTLAPKFSADPQRVDFEAEDGTKLVGYYYPASVEPAPVVVLFHWIAGTHCDWVAVNLVQWLQNRGLPEGAAANPACKDIRVEIKASPQYPALPEGTSYAVFAVNYRGFEKGGWNGSLSLNGWLKDAIAGLKKARSLDGVDPARAAAIGASIGADGAIDACGEGCLGALSLSPGGYLNVKYAAAVEALNAEGKSAWCVAAKGDKDSFPACESAAGDRYNKFIYEKYGHGMDFFAGGFEPQVAQIIFDFLQAAFQ